MKVTLVQNISAPVLMKNNGLDEGGRVQQIFTSRCAAEMDPYAPMQQGTLKNTRIVGVDTVTYNTPYARNMYHGKVMVDPKTGKAGILIKDKNGNMRWVSRKGIAKVKSNREYKFNQAPKRGKLWDKRMWAEKGDKITADVARAIGGGK